MDLPSNRRDSARLGLTATYASDAEHSSEARPAAPGSIPRPPPERIGQRIGGYRITRELGRGGMGVVYEAVHDQLGQRAAVKTLTPELLLLSQNYAQRFFTEARALSMAQHPSLVKLFDFGQLPDQTLYILMELLEGETLSHRLARGPLDEAAALRLTRQIAQAVQAAHERHIVHRDLKPANIFVVSDPETAAGERVKILDFGLAKIVQGQDPSHGGSLQTITGTIMGTPLYMSPEQCRGASTADGKTDVYSLGVMLFEMLAGSPPFVATTAGELIALHLGQSPPSLRRKAPTVSAAAAALVADMLKKDAAARPTMAQVSLQLLQLTAPGRSLVRSTPRWALAVAAGAAAVLAIGAIFGGSHLVQLRSRHTSVLPGSGRSPIVGPPTVGGATRDPVAVPPGRPPWRPPAAAPFPPARLLRGRRTEGKVQPVRKPQRLPSIDAPSPAPVAIAPARVEPLPEDVDVPALR